jgi:fluoride exporter
LPPLPFVLAVGAGGAIGAVMRHAFIMAFPRQAGAFPFVTFAENVVGSFLPGVVLISLLRAPALAARWRPFLATGVLGSFTTFSNVALTAGLGVGFAAAGLWMGAAGVNQGLG